MRSAFRHAAEIRRALAGKRTLVLLDFDGTLSAIAPTPGEARLDARTAGALHLLAQSPRARVAVLSGRPLGYLARHFDDRRFFYGGNHGLEIRGPGFHDRHPGAAALRPRIHALAGAARTAFARISGVFVENKGLTMSVHFRGISAENRRKFQKNLKIFRRKTDSPSLRWRRGKMVWELLPALDWDKGRAAEALRRRLRCRATVAIGDDVTDEDMFRLLKVWGPTVRVGRRGDSAAAYFLPRQKDVPDFLRTLAEALQ